MMRGQLPKPDLFDLSKRSALRFVVLLGAVSLLADMTHEGARSVTGPYLAMLGATGAAVGIVAGFGELVGYVLRLASGLISDRTQRYWTMTLAGYAVNLLAVPLLALAGRWETAAALMIAERVGKALRNPPRDAMLSHVTATLGAGWTFGLHEALDQIGAVMGPLLVTAVMYFRHSYRDSFAVLLIPALSALTILVIARMLYPKPQNLERCYPGIQSHGFPGAYWLYLGAAGLVAAGFADFPLMAFHFQRAGTIPAPWIPALYAMAMAADAVAALIFGRLFDRFGLRVLAGVSLLCTAFAPLAFFGDFWGAIAGAVIWGVGMGAQESVMRASVATLVSPDRRGSAYGIFNAGYGLLWFVGSAAMGWLYDVSIPALVAFSMVTQLLSVPVFLRIRQGGVRS